MKKILNKFNYYINLYKIDHKEKLFLEFVKKKFKLKKNKNYKEVILIENNPTRACHISALYLLNSLIKKYECKVLIYDFNIIYNLKSKILNIFNLFSKTFYYQLLSSITNIEYLKNRVYLDQNESSLILKKIIKKIKNKKDFYNLNVYNINFGPILYDHYLKKYRVPTVELDNKEFNIYLEDSIKLIIYWKNFFESNSVKSVIITHATYWSGIVSKFAIKKNIPVYTTSIEDTFYLSKKNNLPYKKFVYHKKNFKTLFTSREKIKLLKLSKKNLENRMKGNIGVDMRYSKKSAWSTKNDEKVLKKTKKIKVLIAAHCFFDSPNGLGDNLFIDFYEWISFLASVSHKTHYDWYIKTHPDYLPGNMEIINNLSKKFKNITILDSSVSHHSIIKDKIDFVLTVYGSVSFEYAYNKKYVINASLNNPSINYKYNFNPSSIKIYRDMLMKLNKLKLNIDTEEVLECYLMQRILRANNIYFQDLDDFKNKFDKSINNLNTNFYEYAIKDYNYKHHLNIIKKFDNFTNNNNYYL